MKKLKRGRCGNCNVWLNSLNSFEHAEWCIEADHVTPQRKVIAAMEHTSAKQEESNRALANLASVLELHKEDIERAASSKS